MEINGITISIIELDNEKFASLYDLCLALGLTPNEESMNIQMDSYLANDYRGKGPGLYVRASKIFLWAICLNNYNPKLEAFRKKIGEELEIFFATETSTMRQTAILS